VPEAVTPAWLSSALSRCGIEATVGAGRVQRTERGDRLFTKMASDAAWQVRDNDALVALA